MTDSESRSRSGDGGEFSRRYQDYVIRDGKLLGRFEEMYRNSDEVPWHQDVTARAIFSDLTVAILKHRRVTSLLDVGCGLGYVTERLHREIPDLGRVVGLDVSPTAIDKARSLFPEIDFRVGTVTSGNLADERFDVVLSKDVLWYVLDSLPDYLADLARHSSRWVYVAQSFPERRPFLGDDVLPDAQRLLEYIRGCGWPVVYSVVERDADYDGREYAHALIEATR